MQNVGREKNIESRLNVRSEPILLALVVLSSRGELERDFSCRNVRFLVGRVRRKVGADLRTVTSDQTVTR